MNRHKGNSLAEVLAYLKSLLSGKERNAFERKLQRDPFEEEAMEGFETLSPEELQKDLLKLGSRLNRRLERRNRLMIYRIAASMAIIALVSTLYFTLSDRQLKDFKGVPEVSEALREEQKAEKALKEEPDIPERLLPPEEAEEDHELKSVFEEKQSEFQIIRQVQDEEVEELITIEVDAVYEYKEEADARIMAVAEAHQETGTVKEGNAQVPAVSLKEKKGIGVALADEAQPEMEKLVSQPVTASRQAAIPQALNIAPVSEDEGKISPVKDSLAFPTLPKWRLSTDFPVYTPDNLWNYINGAATVYLSFGFTTLRMAEYTKGKNSITVEVYQLKDAYNAFGIYASERSPGYNFIDAGAQGYLEGSVMNFFAGDCYVKNQSTSEKQTEVEVMKEIAEKISRQISKEPAFPEIISRFPLEGKVLHSEKYISQNYLGHGFLSGVFTADYQEDEDNYTMFILEKTSAQECREILRAYFEFTGQNPEEIKEGRMIIRDRYNGDINLLWKGNVIIGVVGNMSEPLMDMME